MLDLLFRYPRSLAWLALIAAAIVAVTVYQLLALP